MTELTERLEQFESRLRSMESELYELRSIAREAAREARAATTPATTITPLPPIQRERSFEPQPPSRAPQPTVRAEPVFTPVPPPAPPREPFDFSMLLGARALAWTGGAVTLLGIVFFFVLAAERGWIGSTARVSLGAIASGLLVGAGAWLRRRHGDSYASVSAAGAGLAGFYATLLAAAALYHLVPTPVALVLAAAIAGLGAAVALAWSSETLAVLGLLGAMLVPVPVALQAEHLSALGTAFAGLVLAAATVVAVRRNWRGLLVTAVVATAPQAIALVLDHHDYATGLAAGFWLVYGAGAIWLTLRTRLGYLPAWLLAFSAAFGGWSAGWLFGGREQGIALLVVAAAYAGTSILMWLRDRNTASVLWAISLTVAAVGAAALASGPTLTIVWAAEAAMLSWLARRIDEPRFQLAALGWLGLAFAHGISIDAPFTKLFVANDNAWHAVPSAAALAAAAGLVGLFSFAWKPRDEGVLTRVLAGLGSAQPWLRLGGFALGGATALYAASLAVVELPSSWDWGHVAVVGLWAAVAVCLALTRLRITSVVVAAASFLLVVAYDLPHLADTPRAWSFAIVAAGLLVVALLFELRSKTDAVHVAALVELILSVLSASFAAVALLDGHRLGFALLGLAACYGATGVAALRRRRDFASALGIAALALAAVATPVLLDGTWVVLAWTAAAAALAVLARFEDRLQYGAVAYFGLAFVHTIVFEAQPSDLFVAHRHPGGGAPAVLLVLAAGAVLARESVQLRRALTWICGALGLYAATLAILEASEGIGGGIETAFQRGHTAVSSLWGVVGLALLVAGLKRGRRELQFGGFALFGIALAKLFVYDLAFLSSIARAFSFIAVGALLVVAGFFYQRLALDSKA
jgi:uncharacterized membrane protein